MTRRNGPKPIFRELSREELLALIDERSRYLLRISGEEFMRRYRKGEYVDSPAAGPIVALAGLVSRR